MFVYMVLVSVCNHEAVCVHSSVHRPALRRDPPLHHRPKEECELLFFFKLLMYRCCLLLVVVEEKQKMIIFCSKSVARHCCCCYESLSASQSFPFFNQNPYFKFQYANIDN